jgi:hypothetical protein
MAERGRAGVPAQTARSARKIVNYCSTLKPITRDRNVTSITFFWGGDRLGFSQCPIARRIPWHPVDARRLHGQAAARGRMRWEDGAGDRSRTCDPLITNQPLYQLSYASELGAESLLQPDRPRQRSAWHRQSGAAIPSPGASAFRPTTEAAAGTAVGLKPDPRAGLARERDLPESDCRAGQPGTAPLGHALPVRPSPAGTSRSVPRPGGTTRSSQNTVCIRKRASIWGA